MAKKTRASVLGRLYDDFTTWTGLLPNEREFSSLLVEAAGGTGANELRATYADIVLPAYENAPDAPDTYQDLCSLIAKYSPLEMFVFCIAWERREQGEYTPNTDWTRAYIDKLPDSSFLYVDHAAANYVDDTGRSHPLSVRYLPYKNHLGNVDAAHAKNAISRSVQTDLPKSLQLKLQEKARKIYAAHGGY